LKKQGFVPDAIVTDRFGSANDECNAASRPDQRNDFFPYMPPSTTTSTSGVI